ncbi:MAG: hypothetical protein LBS10_02030 [Gracilibacteraceae bacterium]|jgi:hypothetical protein|nr:hypothetical protein [Gracilibacteraceae bacterium]
MLKFHRRVALLLLAVVLTAACAAPPPAAPLPPAAPEESRPVQLVRAAYGRMAAAKSYDLAFSMKMSSAAAESELTITGTASYFLQPAEIRLLMDMALRVGEGETTHTAQEQYIIAENDEVTMYFLRAGRWYKSAAAAPELQQALAMDPADDIKLFMENLRTAEIAGEELVGERPAYKIIARTSGDMLHELLPDTGEGAGVPESFFREAGDLQFTLWVDTETETLVKCHADLTEFMHQLADAVDDFAAQKGLGPAAADALRVTLTDLKAEAEYTVANLGAAAPFILPAAAAEAVNFEEERVKSKE